MCIVPCLASIFDSDLSGKPTTLPSNAAASRVFFPDNVVRESAFNSPYRGGISPPSLSERGFRSDHGVAVRPFVLPELRVAGEAALVAAEPVDVELVLAVDMSRSMDLEEFALQRAGYVAALRHPDFMKAVRAGLHGRIALTYFEWAGTVREETLVPWQIIDSAETAEAFAGCWRIGRCAPFVAPPFPARLPSAPAVRRQ